MSEDTNAGEAIEDPTDLRFVGPATATVLADRNVDATDIAGRRVSYAQLVEAGVNPGVAARIRREHSLPWSFESTGADLKRRSTQIRGLGEAERAWVAASSGDWDADQSPSSPAETDGSGDPKAAETAWRTRSRPTPVTALPSVDAESAALLAEAGIASVRRLATADPDRVADVLDLDASTVRRWHEAARDRGRRE
ncbi:helix-hairpin-helix domain-containing protein [Halegenticoccus soli]|uniref:helix-hairpin-helix domain-containing protein n=1 Tax=Halegenticoccus soli TaxID=1985678 RepID=UPI000C6EADB9|nr:helix-hairpin-helix domain-containing protein [Halegenticoccus soli]